MATFEIKTIPHNKQRLGNGDVADYYKEGNKYTIAVSDLKNKDYNFLVALHEFIELHMVLKRGLPIEDIDKWDNENEDMGDDPRSPYHHEHIFATAVEMIVAERLGVNWGRYTKHIEKLAEGKRYDPYKSDKQ